MSVEQTLKERGSRYGDFSVHAEICQDFMRVMKWARNQNAWPDLSDVQRQALTVIADKIARILSGDPDYADNWHDIQGYAKLVEERLPAAQHEQESRVAVAIDKLASHAELHSTIFAHDRFAPEYPEQRPVCPDCGAPEGELHYVLCPRLQAPEEHAKAVEEAFAAEQFDEHRADIIGQNGNDGEHYAVPEGVDINDWRTWQVGDKLECVEAYVDGDSPCDEIAAHEIVTIVEVEPREYGGDLPIKVQGTRYFGWPDFDDYGQPEGALLRQLFRFHSRPNCE